MVELIEQMRAARDRLGDREAREALSEAGPTNGGGAPGRTVSEAFVELRDAVAELQELEVVLRDLDRGCWTSPRCATAARSTSAGRTARTPSASGTSRRPASRAGGRSTMAELARRTFRAARVLNLEQRGAAAARCC